MDKFYKLLQLNSTATDEEVTAQYNALKEKYSEDRFLEGEEGNIAAKKLTELEIAYQEIMNSRRQEFTKEKSGDDFLSVEAAIKAGNLQHAQSILDKFDQRNGEWHYLQSVVYYKKNWLNESKKQLEIACTLEPDNAKFKNALDKMNAQINGTQNAYKNWNTSGNYQNPAPNGQYSEQEVQQMGGQGCIDWCCQMAICNLMLNCCCGCR